MDLLSDIVEKNLSDDENNDDNSSSTLDFQIKENDLSAYTDNSNNNGFPDLYKPKKISSWKQRLREKKMKAKQNDSLKGVETVKTTENIRQPVQESINTKDGNKRSFKRDSKSKLSEAQSIHKENINLMSGLSEDQILKEQRELMESLDPKLIQNLLKNINKRMNDESDNKNPLFAEIEGASGTWVGGVNENSLPYLNDSQVNKALDIQTFDNGTNSSNKSNEKVNKTVQFAEDMKEDIEEEKKKNNNQEFDIRENEVSEDEDFYNEDLDDVAPLDYQMAQSIDHMANEKLLNDVHFMKRNGGYNHSEEDHDLDINKLDINDPDFNEKLHVKYFPDLPKDVDKLKWMAEVPDIPNAEEEPNKFIIDDVSLIRFDFNGNLVPPTRKIDSTIHSGLHHHSTDPQLAGYTIPELNRLSRSTYPAQRSIAIQTLGRILYKLGKQTYYQLVPEIDSETYKEDGSIQNVMNKIYSMIWALIKDEAIIESLEMASNEKFTKNLSVRTYAIDALWLWKKGKEDDKAA